MNAYKALACSHSFRSEREALSQRNKRDMDVSRKPSTGMCVQGCQGCLYHSVYIALKAVISCRRGFTPRYFFALNAKNPDSFESGFSMRLWMNVFHPYVLLCLDAFSGYRFRT